MRDRAEPGHATLNLVASDLFFGLGAVILFLVAAISVGLQDIVSQALDDRAAGTEETREAVSALAVDMGAPVLLADAAGLHRLEGATVDLIPLDDLWSSDRLGAWLGGAPLLVVALSGEDTAFLIFSRAATLSADPLVTLRLTQDCHRLRQTGQTFACDP